MSGLDGDPRHTWDRDITRLGRLLYWFESNQLLFPILIATLLACAVVIAVFFMSA